MKKIFGSELLFFGWWCWSCVFWWVFAYVFVFFWRFAPETVWKMSLDVRSGVFLFFVLSSFGFLVDVVLVFSLFKKQSSGSNRTPLHTHLFCCSFSPFLCPAAFVFCPFWPCVPLLGVLLGVPFWAPCVFGILLVLVLRPLFSWDARRQGFSCASLALFSFSPCVLFCGHTFSRRTGGGLTNPRVVLPTPRRSDSQGTAQSWAGALDAPFSGILSAFFVCQRVTGTLGRMASRAFLSGKGAFSWPPHRPFFTRTFLLFPAPGFFFCCLALGALLDCWQHDDSLTLILNMAFRELLREYPGNTRELCGTRSVTSVSQPREMFGFSIVFRGKCCPFCHGIFS